MSYTLPEIFGSGIFNTAERLKYRDCDTSVPTLPRTVREYELELFLEDGGSSVINGQRHEIKKGCILLASPGDKRQSFLHFKALFVHFSITDPKFAEMIASIPRFLTECNYEKYFPMFSSVCTPEAELTVDTELETAVALGQLLCSLKGDSAAEIKRLSPKYDRPDIKRAVEYIGKHYSEALNADTLAKMCNLSTSYFYKVFTQITDLTPNDYITTVRLAAAERLLNSTDLAIVEVATKSGFNSQSYFAVCFKSRHGISPKEYRKKHFYRV